jgi:hypothetical protein
MIVYNGFRFWFVFWLLVSAYEPGGVILPIILFLWKSEVVEEEDNSEEEVTHNE